MNITVSNSSSLAVAMASPAANTVSYQSAFLGLVPLALNAMAQPSFFDRPFAQSSLLFAARSSPFICIADTLEIIIEVVFYILFQRLGIRDAAARSCRRRARHRIGEDALRIEETGPEKHPWAFVVLSVGAVLQAVKIFGMGGIPLTQAGAGVYLASFVVFAVMPMVAQPGWREDDAVSTTGTANNFNKMTETLAWFGLAGNFLTSGWVLYLILDIPTINHFDTLSWIDHILLIELMSLVFLLYIGFVGISPWLPFWLAGYAFKFLWKFETTTRFAGALFAILHPALNKIAGLFNADHAPRPAWVPYVIAAGLLAMLCEPLIVWWATGYYTLTYLDRFLDFVTLEVSWVSALSYGLLIIGQYLAALEVGVQILDRVSESLWLRRLPKAERWKIVVGKRRPMLRRVVFALSNFGLGLLFYRLRYDPTGSVRPGWTENLG